MISEKDKQVITRISREYALDLVSERFGPLAGDSRQVFVNFKIEIESVIKTS